MEPDLPLLEISGEDDSLIQQTPTSLNDAVKVADSFFSLSPMQLPISPIKQSMENNVAPKRPSCLSPKAINKENMNFNKAEGPKLTPHQMKRRKRGYNLRKSLAWDKAFFTEEGVLDPDELSMISGTYGNSCGEALSAISEERTKSPYSSSKYRFVSENLQASSANKNINNGAMLLPRRNLVAAESKVTEEVCSNSSSCNRSGIKTGRCPRPLPPSTLKRPAHVHNTKSAKKDSHLPKIPDYKSGLHSLPRTSKISMLGTSQLKHNPTVITHKNLSLEGSCKIVKSTQNKEKSVSKCTQLPSKASVQPSKENMVNTSSEVNVLTNAQTSHSRKLTRISEPNQNTVIPSSTLLSGEGLNRPKEVAGLLPQRTSITVGNESQLQKMKPSGLRMPSPSLGYFGQNNTQPSNIPKCTAIGSRKFVRDFRAPHAPSNKSMDIPENSVSAQCSELGPSKAAMHKAIKSDLMVSNMKNVNITLVPDKSSESKRSKPDMHGDFVTEETVGRHGKQKYINDITDLLDTNIQITNNLKVLKSGTCEKSREDNHGRRISTHGNFTLTSEQFGEESNLSSLDTMFDPCFMNSVEAYRKDKDASTSTRKQAERGTEPNCTKITQHNPVPFCNDWLASVDGANEEHDEPFMQLPEPVKLFACDANQGSYVEIHSLGCDISKDTSSNMEDNDVKALSSCGTERKSNEFLCKSKHSGQENEATTIVHQLSDSTDLTGQLQDHNDIERKSSILMDNLELQSPCLRVECYQFNSQFYSKEFRGEKVNTSDEFVIQERSRGSKSERNCSEVIFALSPAQNQDAEFDITLLTEQPSLKAQFDLVEVSPAVDIQNCSTDTQFRHEVLPSDNTTSLNAHKPFLGEVCGSLVQCDQALKHESDESVAHSSRDNAIMECVADESWLDSTGEGKTVDVSQNDYSGRIVEESLMLRTSNNSEFANLESAHEDTNGIDNLSSKSCIQISHGQHMNIIATSEQFEEEQNLSTSGIVSDKCSGNSDNTYVNDSDATLSMKHSESGRKCNSLIVPQPDAVPFSDEWLAAIEAAGEDILTKKSGAVQNSPTDKSLPEPSPWSPVKRKINEIGPFDCTKCINTQPADL
ncbi:uncharacterized protein LOC108206408 isoform X1 [Daucus carota subsp. sativus]|uniref:uncharacterized protein LOC108206408 isoform X1 n=1 Tax=Daucus carota subsp. sativus TaxID=79200 RepID=UPI0007F03E7D|nr:PREDICTED: uncharacterized protein LOC108206408 isoform X1 [Daucus carota subsp. sativus]